MKGVLEGDDRRSTGGDPSDLDRILDCFRPTIDQERFLRSVSRRRRGEALRELDVRGVVRDTEAHVQETSRFLLNGVDDPGRRVTDVERADPCSEVDVATPVDVPNLRSMGMVDDDWIVRRDA